MQFYLLLIYISLLTANNQPSNQKENKNVSWWNELANKWEC